MNKEKRKKAMTVLAIAAGVGIMLVFLVSSVYGLAYIAEEARDFIELVRGPAIEGETRDTMEFGFHEWKELDDSGKMAYVIGFANGAYSMYLKSDLEKEELWESYSRIADLHVRTIVDTVDWAYRRLRYRDLTVNEVIVNTKNFLEER